MFLLLCCPVLVLVLVQLYGANDDVQNSSSTVQCRWREGGTMWEGLECRGGRRVLDVVPFEVTIHTMPWGLNWV